MKAERRTIMKRIQKNINIEETSERGIVVRRLQF